MIDIDPSNASHIYSTMKFVYPSSTIRRDSNSYIRPTLVLESFNDYKVSTKWLWSKRLVIKLGSFHIQTSFLGSIAMITRSLNGWIWTARVARNGKCWKHRDPYDDRQSCFQSSVGTHAGRYCIEHHFDRWCIQCACASKRHNRGATSSSCWYWDR